MKYTYETIDNLNTAFTNLPVKGLTIMTTAENMMKLDPHIKAVLMVKDKLIKKYTDGKEQISQDHKEWNKFAAEYSQIIKKEVEVADLGKIKKADVDLNKETNVNLQSVIKVLLENGLLE